MPAWIRKNDKLKKIADALMKGKPQTQAPVVKRALPTTGMPDRVSSEAQSSNLY